MKAVQAYLLQHWFQYVRLQKVAEISFQPIYQGNPCCGKGPSTLKGCLLDTGSIIDHPLYLFIFFLRNRFLFYKNN